MSWWNKSPHTMKMLKVPEEDDIDGSVSSAAGTAGRPPLSHSKPVITFLMAACKPSLQHQCLPTSRGCKPGLSHSSLSSQGDRTSIKRAPSLSLYKPSDWVPILSKASQVESNCTIDICEEGANIIEGSSGVDDFTNGNEQEDCNHLEDPGVESV